MPPPPPLPPLVFGRKTKHERVESAPAVTASVTATETAGERAEAMGQRHHPAVAMETSRPATHPSSHRHPAHDAIEVRVRLVRQSLSLPLLLLVAAKAMAMARFATALARLPTVPALLLDHTAPDDLAV